MSFDATRSSPVKAGPLSDAYEASQAQSSSISNSDPWNTSSRHQGIQAASIPSAFAPAYESGQQQTEEREGGAGEEMGFGERGMDAGSGAGWAMGEQKRVEVSGRDELGGRLLLTHKVYFVKSENGVVERRFRDFVYLQDVLVKRYPFRLLPSLPPKRLSVAGKYLIAGDVFLERRRRSLERFLNTAINHPILQNDPLFHTFLSLQSSFGSYTTSNSIPTIEEALTKTLSPSEIDLIPSDLDTKLAQLRARLIPMIDHWNRISATYERILTNRLKQSMDFSRIKSEMETVVEVERSGWRSAQVNEVENDELQMAVHFGRQSEILEASYENGVSTFLEELKRHLALYLSMRDLLLRQTTLSPDNIDKLRKKVDSNMIKVEAIRSSPTPSASEKPLLDLVSAIEADQSTIDQLLKRRIFIRHCLWAEIQHLFRSTSLMSRAFKALAVDQKAFAGREVGNWTLLGEALDRN